MSASPSPGRKGVDLLRALAERQGLPAGVHLQVADRCNHACQHCYQVQGQKGELTLEQVKAVVDDLAAAGVMTLSVSGGEATLRPDLVEILTHARARGFATRLYTNAFLIDDAMAARLSAVGLYEVHVSVYSARADEHDAVTRVPGSWSRTVDGVRALRMRGVRVVLKCPTTSVAESGAAGMAALARELGCHLVQTTEITPREDGSLEPTKVRAEPRSLVARGLLAPWRPSEDVETARAKKRAGASCGVGASGVVVLSDGSIQACTDTRVTLGDVTRTTFREALQNSDEASFFRQLTWDDVHGCRDCDLLPACHRCHATALQEGGDYLGPYESACARARARYEAGEGSLCIERPDATCAPERRVEVGPYQIVAPGVLRPVADVLTLADEERAARFSWLRREATGDREDASRLVPLRRKDGTALRHGSPPVSDPAPRDGGV